MAVPSKAAVTAAFGPDDLSDHTEQQIIREMDTVRCELEGRTAYGTNTEDQRWRMARLRAALARSQG
ncbi:hypothetical protein [Nocardia mangyaensis]|uniref:hypothetical protein n=1 Tax=Nocardia mangyaensis TaxID=2213200 RepID=UPI002675B610|nr:hypothetical protein [Nocardia mangyaensis]MDO3647689.1 hypothetical protein [Nocardia mangyaensis]